MKSSAAVIASKAKMEQRLEYVKAELAVAREREVFHDGQVYTLSLGKPGEKAEVEGALLGQLTNDKGMLKLRFQVGSGMDMRIVDAAPTTVVRTVEPIYDEEGKEIKIRSSGILISLIKKIEDRLANFEQDLQDALAREALIVGDVYTVKVGRGETRREIQAMLYAQEQNEKGTRVRFFAGEGFGAEFFDGTPAMVVTKGVAEEDPEFDEATADAAEAEKEVQELEQAAALEAEAESQAAAE